jgi:hypothetical protein
MKDHKDVTDAVAEAVSGQFSTSTTPRPVVPLRHPGARQPQETAHNPFGSLQEAQQAVVSAQKRLDELASRLIGEPPRFVSPESPSVSPSGGLLALTGLCARNIKARAEHIERVAEQIEAAIT